MKIKTAALAIVGAVFLSSQAAAQAPVVDRVVNSPNNNVADQTVAARNNYLEIQALRQEVSSLRGLIEELSYELRKIKQRQDEDYQDLDRRITSGGGPNVSAPVASADSVTPTPQTGESSDGADELYRNGFGALREGNRDGAVQFFEQLVQNYPGSSREADSLYWLGETHWLNLEIEKSRQSFVQLMDTYPGYRKAFEAQYRLGLIYSQLGDQDKAMEYMRALAEGDNSQSGAARTFLQEHGEQ